jgi:hypothetical protein
MPQAAPKARDAAIQLPVATYAGTASVDSRVEMTLSIRPKSLASSAVMKWSRSSVS